MSSSGKEPERTARRETRQPAASGSPGERVVYFRTRIAWRPPVVDDLLERLREAVGDRYDLERELGRGGMSLVFAATERALGRRVAIKVVRPELAGGVNTERFRREIQVAASLQHPHIVPVLNTGAVGELLYYVMPLVDGLSLRDYLERERHLSIDEALRITREVAGALEYAHRRGAIPRGIKPGDNLVQGVQSPAPRFRV